MEDLPGKGIEHAHVLQVLAVGLHLHLLALGLGKALGGGAAELPLVLGQLPEGELVVFAHQLAQGAGDFKAVGAGGVAGGGDEHAGGAVGELQVGGDVILHLDVVPLTLLAEGLHRFGQAANPLEEVQLVGALV